MPPVETIRWLGTQPLRVINRLRDWELLSNFNRTIVINYVIDNDELMDLDDMSRYMKVSKRTIHKWIKSGIIPNPDMSVSRTKRWFKSTIIKMMKGNKCKAQ